MTISNVTMVAAQPNKVGFTPDQVAALFPEADRAGEREGRPPATPVRKGDDTVGYLFRVADVVDAPGFLGLPFDIIAGVDSDGRIAGALLIGHNEPAVGKWIAVEDLARQAATMAGESAYDAQPPAADSVSGASISVRLMRDAIHRAAFAVARARDLPDPNAPPIRALSTSFDVASDWTGLIEQGLVKRLRVSNGDAAALWQGAGAQTAMMAGPSDSPFVDIAVAPLAVPGLAEALLATSATDKPPSAGTVLIALGGGLARMAAESGRIEIARLAIRQGSSIFDISETGPEAISSTDLVAPGRPPYRRIIRVDLGADFDPTLPWSVSLRAQTMDGGATTFGLPYALPSGAIDHNRPDLLTPPASAPAPFWVAAWMNQPVRIGVLVVALIALTILLVIQDKIARHRPWQRWLRLGYLTFTVLWIGWYAGTQLSVMHLIGVLNAPFRLSGIEPLLAQPVIVILAAYAALSLVLLGRGVFCGWLCPFGALQELINQAARQLRIPQIRLPYAVNERLWALKYLAVIGLVALSFLAIDRVPRATEIEPFGTVFGANLVRAWPYVVFALAILAIGVVLERAFCRYLCPLGAGFAIFGRIRLIDWLKRRPECGVSCQKCAERCRFQAIAPEGGIVATECFQCLDCQVDYHDPAICPPLHARRARLARIGAAPAPTQRVAAAKA